MQLNGQFACYQDDIGLWSQLLLGYPNQDQNIGALKSDGIFEITPNRMHHCLFTVNASCIKIAI